LDLIFDRLGEVFQNGVHGGQASVLGGTRDRSREGAHEGDRRQGDDDDRHKNFNESIARLGCVSVRETHSVMKTSKMEEGE
jgi:hypothetical protein